MWRGSGRGSSGDRPACDIVRGLETGTRREIAVAPQGDETFQCSGSAFGRYLADKGIRIHTGTVPSAISRENGEMMGTATVNSDEREFRAGEVLMTVGRTPNTMDLRLQEFGVEVDEDGFIVVDHEMRMSRPGVYAAGEVRAAGHTVRTSVLPLEYVIRVPAARDTRGLIKLVADGVAGAILGGHVIAPGGGETIQIVALTVEFGIGLAGLDDTPFPYLILSEKINLAA